MNCAVSVAPSVHEGAEWTKLFVVVVVVVVVVVIVVRVSFRNFILGVSSRIRPRRGEGRLHN